MVVREVLTSQVVGFPISIYYDIRDDGNSPGNPEHNFGLLTSAYTDKPAVAALRTLHTFSSGSRSTGSLITNMTGLHALRLESEDDIRLVVWMDRPGPHLEVEVPSKDVIALDIIERPVDVIRSAGGSIIKCSEEAGPVYIIIPRAFETTLHRGWNLISLPLAPLIDEIGAVLKSIDGRHYEAVYAYDPLKGAYKAYIPDQSEISELSRMEMGRGYWIYAKKAAVLRVTGTATWTSIDLKEGWNLIGYPSIDTRPLADVLRPIEGKFDVIHGYDSAEGRYTAYSDYASDLKSFEGGRGYWIYATADVVIPSVGP
jgi:hypothetical protein